MPRRDTHPFAVLIVEDRPDVADSLALFLRAIRGYDTHTAYDGVVGLEAALRLSPDAVVCDLGLPRKTGLTLAEELCRLLSNKPVLIAISAYADEAIRGRARWAGFDHFLAKPADPWEVDALLQQHATTRGTARVPVTNVR